MPRIDGTRFFFSARLRQRLVKCCDGMINLSFMIADAEILNRELGPVAMIRFLQHFEKGYGDYSKERHEWIDKLSVSDIAYQIQNKRKQPR